MGILRRLFNGIENMFDRRRYRRADRKAERTARRAQRKYERTLKKIQIRQANRAKLGEQDEIFRKKLLWRIFAASEMNGSGDFGMVTELCNLHRRQAKMNLWWRRGERAWR